MFVGHYGVAFGLKRADPKLSLGSLFLAVQLVDLLWGIFLLLGWEHVRVEPGFTAASPLVFTDYPLSHSLLAALCWAVVAGAVAYSLPTRDTSRHHARAAMLIAVAVASHWFLDLIVHVPDLPLSGTESTHVGLGLWQNLPLSIAAELVVFSAGLLLYLTSSSRRIHPRPWRVATLVIVSVGLYLTAFLGPPPDSVTVLGISAIVLYLGLAALAAWADRPAPVR